MSIRLAKRTARRRGGAAKAVVAGRFEGLRSSNRLSHFERDRSAGHQRRGVPLGFVNRKNDSRLRDAQAVPRSIRTRMLPTSRPASSKRSATRRTSTFEAMSGHRGSVHYWAMETRCYHGTRPHKMSRKHLDRLRGVDHAGQPFNASRTPSDDGNRGRDWPGNGWSIGEDPDCRQRAGLGSAFVTEFDWVTFRETTAQQRALQNDVCLSSRTVPSVSIELTLPHEPANSGPRGAVQASLSSQAMHLAEIMFERCRTNHQGGYSIRSKRRNCIPADHNRRHERAGETFRRQNASTS